MHATIPPRLDPPSQLTWNLRPFKVDVHIAMAEGLTESEAKEVAAWLQAAGYRSVKVEQRGVGAAVHWTR